MACKIRNLTDSAVQSAITNVVVKTAGKYKPEGTTLSIDTKDFSLEELTSIVEKWSTDTYKTAAFTNNWFTVNETPDKVVINFTAPNKLIKAYEVKLGIKSLDQVNNELMGLDEDISLAQQSTTTSFYQETGSVPIVFDSLENLTDEQISELESTVKYSLDEREQDDLLKRGNTNVYYYLKDRDADKFDRLVKRNNSFPSEFKIEVKTTRYEKREGSLAYDSWNEYRNVMFYKLNKNKKSNLYRVVDTKSGEEIMSKVRVLSKSKNVKEEIADKYGLEFTPTTVFSANRSIAFSLYLQKPNKKKYAAFAKKYLYDAIKFLNPDESGFKNLNFDLVEQFLAAYPEEMWDYINTTYSPEDSTNINASIHLQNSIKFKLPKLGLLTEIEKITGIKLQGESFKNYDRSGGVKKVLRVEWGEVVVIDYKKMTTKQLRKAISYYLQKQNYFKPSSEEQNVRKYAEHKGIDYNELRELVFGDLDKALENIVYNTTGNSDTMEVSKWRESIREYNWQAVELFSKPYEDFLKKAKDKVIEKFKDKTLSNGISHLDYFFSGNFNWLNINFNNISGQYYGIDMETESSVGVEKKMGGIINPFEMSIYTKPKPGKDFLKSEEVFNRLAAILHEPFHALHALSYGTREELDLRKAFKTLYETSFGKKMINEIFGTYNNKNISLDVAYKEFAAFTAQLMLFPKSWIQSTDLRSNDIYEFFEKVATLSDKTYSEIVKSIEKIGTEEVTVTKEEFIKLNFLQKLYNYIVKALAKVIPLSKKFFEIIPQTKLVNETVIKDVFGETEKNVVRTVPLPAKLKAQKEEFLTAMDEFKTAINTLMSIDSELFSSDNTTNFFRGQSFYQEASTPQEQPVSVNTLDQEVSIKLPSYDEQVEEFFQNAEDSYNPSATYSQEQSSSNFGNEAITTLMQVLSDNLGVPFEIVESSEEAAKILRDSGLEYNNEPAFFFNGKVYFVQNRINAEIVFHEFAHPLIQSIRISNPKLFNQLYDQLISTPEGQAILERVQRLYDYTGDRLKEEVIVTAIGLEAEMSGTGKTVSKPYKTWLDKIMFHIKQFLRKLFGNKITVEKLSPNTSLKTLVDMMTGETFALNSEVFTTDEVAEFIKLEVEDQKLFVEAVERNGQEVINLIASAQVAAQEFEQLIKRSNDVELKKILDNDPVLKNIKSTVSQAKQSVTAIVGDAIAKNQQASSVIYALMGYEQILNTIYANVNAMRNLSATAVTPESIARILYYNDLAQYIDTEFISVLEEALNVPGTGLATAATNRQALREVINALQSSRSLINNIKNLHNIILEGQLTGFLTALTKDMNENINLKFGDRFKEIAEKGGASEALAEKIKEKLLARQDLTPQEKSAISKGAENALNKVIKEYKGVDITPEKIRAELVGETSNMNWLNAYLEGYSASQSLISGPFFAYLKNKYAEVDAQAASISADMINELQPYLKNLSKNEILLLGKAVAFEDTVADLDDKGELAMRKVWSYLNQFQNYRYDLSKLEYTLAKANESKDQDAIRKAYMELRQFKRDYMWQKYDKSFYDVEYDVYDKNDVTRDALREKEILLNELKIERTPLQTEQDRFNSYSKIRALERQLKELSKLTYEDGTDKIDDPSRNIYDKTKALTHKEYNERIKKFYEYNLIEGEFQRALQSFESSLIAEGLAQDEIDKRLNEWLDQNTRVEFSEQYFVDKQNAINALEYFISTKFPAGARNQRVVDIHRQISDLLILSRDPSGQIDISVLSKETRTLIKDLQEEIIQIQKDQVNASGLSSNEWARYNYLSKKPSMLTPTESDEYAFLRDKLDSIGLNKTDKETYYRLLGDISELTSKKPTQDYIDTINYWLSGKLGLAELDEEGAEKLTEKNTADYYMSLDGDFRDWFLDNHVVRENKDGEYYERVYIWNRIQPDEKYLKKTTVELSDGSKRTIDAVPGSRFYKRSVKKEFMTLKTDDWSKYVGVYIDNTNLSDNPNFLPRLYKPGDPNSAKDDRYINKDFQNLDKNSDIAKILEIMKKYHLKTQSFVSTYGKLYLDLPRFGIEDNQELILRGEIKKKALRTWTQVKGLISKEAREEAPLFPETGEDVNYDTQRNMIRVNSLGEEQEYIPIGGLSRLEIDQVSLDVIRTTHKYLFSALRYKQLSEMDPLGRALRDFTSSEENALKDTKKVNRNIYRTKGITKFAKSRRQDLRALQISHLYDREFLGVQNNDFGNNPYLNKITKFFMKQVSFGFFALDLVSATKNWGGQVVQNVIESAGGKYISVYSLAVGSKMAHQQMVRMQGQRYEKGNPSLETQLLLNFDPGQSYFSQNFGKTQARSFISDVTSLSFFMSPRKFLERQSVLELFFGMMHHKVITRTTSEGVVNIRYIDAWELDGASKLKLKDGVDKKYDLGGSEYAKFKTLAQSVANKLYGAYSDIDLPMANKYYAYKVTTFLRRFFTEMFMNRFGFSTREGNVGGYRYNWAMSNVERGYYVEGFLALLRMFNVSNKYWQFMSKDEKYALRKITMELAILVVLYMMSTILFGYDPDDEERYRKLRAKSGDMFSDNFNIDWWLAQHTILFAKNVFAETSSFIPLPKLGLEDIRDNADLTSLVFGRSIGQMGTLAKDIFYMSIGSEKALYTRNVGPFPWQEKESYKIYNHLFNMMGVKGKFYDPVGRGIMPQESVEARK